LDTEAVLAVIRAERASIRLRGASAICWIPARSRGLISRLIFGNITVPAHTPVYSG